MLCLYDHADAEGIQGVGYGLCDVCCQFLLNLETAGKAVDDPGKLGDADHAVSRQIQAAASQSKALQRHLKNQAARAV